jgi:hypothetical protein
LADCRDLPDQDDASGFLPRLTIRSEILTGVDLASLACSSATAANVGEWLRNAASIAAHNVRRLSVQSQAPGSADRLSLSCCARRLKRRVIGAAVTHHCT